MKPGEFFQMTEQEIAIWNITYATWYANHSTHPARTMAVSVANDAILHLRKSTAFHPEQPAGQFVAFWNIP